MASKTTLVEIMLSLLLLGVIPLLTQATEFQCTGIETPLMAQSGRIAFVAGSHKQNDLFVVNGDGSNVENLTHNPQNIAILDPAWSHDGQSIAFSAGDTSQQDDPQQMSSIQVIRMDDCSQTTLVEATAANFYPVWSADDKQIAFESVLAELRGAEIDIVNADGTGLTPLFQWTNGVWNQWPAWSPDGKMIAYMGSGGMWGYLNIFNLEQSDWVDLGQSEFPQGGSTGGLPAWSPDGQQIAFALHNSPGVFIVNKDGHDLKQLTDLNVAYEPVFFSPDGAFVAFRTSGDTGEPSNIYVVDVEGKNLRNLTQTTTTLYGNPVWSPDSKQIAFVAKDGAQADLVVMELDTNQLSKLTNQMPLIKDSLISWIDAKPR